MFKGLLSNLRYSEDIRISEQFLEEQYNNFENEVRASLYPHYHGKIHENGYLIEEFRQMLENRHVKSAFENAPNYMNEEASHPHLILRTFICISSHIPQNDINSLAKLISKNRVFKTSVKAAERARVSQVLEKIGEMLKNSNPEKRSEQLSFFAENGLLNEIMGKADSSVINTFRTNINSLG